MRGPQEAGRGATPPPAYGGGARPCGAPFESVGTIRGAGALNVLYGTVDGLTGLNSQVFHQNSPDVDSSAEEGDDFGFALAAGDFNNDGFDDLAVGVPFEDAGATPDAGVVNVLYGTANGPTATGGRLFTQVGSQPETGESFGDALAAGDFDDDGFADLAAGAPFEDAFATSNAGAVSVLPGSAGGVTSAGSQILTQDTPGVESSAEQTTTSAPPSPPAPQPSPHHRGRCPAGWEEQARRPSTATSSPAIPSPPSATRTRRSPRSSRAPRPRSPWRRPAWWSCWGVGRAGRQLLGKVGDVRRLRPSSTSPGDQCYGHAAGRAGEDERGSALSATA